MRKEREESQERQFVEMIAPEQLPPGHNFYAQPPFATVIQQVSEATEMPDEQVREIVSYVLKRDIAVVNRNEGFWSPPVPDEKSFLDTCRTRLRNQYKVNFTRQQVGEGIELIIGGFEDYPYLAEYFRAKYPSGQYLNNGEYHQTTHLGKTARHLEVPTYASWVTGFIERQQSIRNLEYKVVVEEIFDEHTPETGMKEEIDRTGKGNVNKRYKILRGAEFIPDQRL